MKIIIKARRIAMPRCIILTPLYAVSYTHLTLPTN